MRYLHPDWLGHCLKPKQYTVSKRNSAPLPPSPLSGNRNCHHYRSPHVQFVKLNMECGAFFQLLSLSLYLLFIRFAASSLCCTSKSTMKHRQKADWKLDHPWSDYGDWNNVLMVCWFFDSTVHGSYQLCSMLGEELWRCSPISFKHVFFMMFVWL